MVNNFKIMLNISLENITNSCVIFGNFPLEIIKPFNCLMSALIYPIGIGIVNEGFFKYWLNDVTKRMMDNPIPEMRLANPSCFWVSKNKSL